MNFPATPATAALFLMILANGGAAAQSYKFTTIDYQNYYTALHGINKSNVSAADFTDSSSNDHCFIVTGTSQALLNDPKGINTACLNINKAGTVAGYYNTGATYVGFTYTGTTFTDIPGPKGATLSQAYEANDKGVIVGTYIDATNTQRGFILKGKKYTSFDAPNSIATLGVGIDNAGDYTMQAYDSSNAIHSYLVAGGKTTEINFPGATVTRIHTINNTGLVALAYVDGAGVRHGGIYTVATGKYTTVDVPGASATAIQGINDKQAICGWFMTASNPTQQGFRAVGHVK